MNLIIQPDAGLGPVIAAIQRARQNVDIAIVRTDRNEIEKVLAAAVQRGVRVRVLVAHTNRGGENRLRKLEQALLEHGVTVEPTHVGIVALNGVKSTFAVTGSPEPGPTPLGPFAAPQ